MIYDVKATNKITKDQVEFWVSGETVKKNILEARRRAAEIFDEIEANIIVKLKIHEDKTDPRQGKLFPKKT